MAKTPPPPPPPPPPPIAKSPSSTDKTQWPKFAGIVMIIIAVLALLGIAFGVFWKLLWTYWSFGWYSGGYGYSPMGSFSTLISWICSIISWTVSGGLSVMALIGAFSAFKRSNWVLALVGAICAVVLSLFAGFGIPSLCCLNWLLAAALFVLAIVACVLVGMSKDEFKK